MPTCLADPKLTRTTIDGFQFPLGAYPVEELTPVPGYTLNFESADGDDSGQDWEEWPDRFVFDIVVTANRTKALCRSLLALFPGRVFPILDILGQDAFREIDPYISYDLMGSDRFSDALRAFSDFFFEDGMCGFGCMSEEPFLYLFVDEHKIVTVRAEPSWKERIVRVLEAFDLEQKETPAGADSAAHEHRGVLVTPRERPELLGFEEIVEFLKEDWRLLLNVDPDNNVDDVGNELGVTGWRVIVRFRSVDPPASSSSSGDDPSPASIAQTAGSLPPALPAPSEEGQRSTGGITRYAEVLLAADSLTQAEEVGLEAAEQLLPAERPKDDWEEPFIVAADRVTPETLAGLISDAQAAQAGTALAKSEGSPASTSDPTSQSAEPKAQPDPKAEGKTDGKPDPKPDGKAKAGRSKPRKRPEPATPLEAGLVYSARLLS